MVSIIFILLFVVGIIFALGTNNIEELNNALSLAPKEAMLVYFDTAYTLIFWSGILQLCVDSGLINKMSKLLIFIIKPLFKNIPKDDIALKYISMNLITNMLAVGSAATPFGLKAFKRLDELNNYSDVASAEMITFMNLNTSCICILPVYLISTRTMYGGSNHSIVIVGIIITGLMVMAFSMSLNKVCEKYAKD